MSLQVGDTIPEFKLYNHDKESYEDKDFKIYKPIKNMCWAAPTPCAYRSSFVVEDWYGYKIVKKGDK